MKRLQVLSNGNQKKVLSEESIKSPATSKNTVALGMIFSGTKIRVKFDVSCLKQGKITFKHKITLNLHIVYEINYWSYDLGTSFTLGDSLFWAVKLTKNGDTAKYYYSEYGIGFDAHSPFSLSSGYEFGENVIIIGIDNSSSADVDNRKKDILILGKAPTDRIDCTTITSEAKYITEQQRKFCLVYITMEPTPFC